MIARALLRELFRLFSEHPLIVGLTVCATVFVLVAGTLQLVWLVQDVIAAVWNTARYGLFLIGSAVQWTPRAIAGWLS